LWRFLVKTRETGKIPVKVWIEEFAQNLRALRAFAGNPFKVH
jgi:hypothetical protein